MQSPFDVAEDMLESSNVWLARIMHVQANLLNSVSVIQPGECEVLQGTCKTPKLRGVLNRWTISRQLGVGVHGSRARLALGHASALQDIQHVLSLREEKACAMAPDMHPQKVVQLTKILHAELLL